MEDIIPETPTSVRSENQSATNPLESAVRERASRRVAAQEEMRRANDEADEILADAIRDARGDGMSITAIAEILGMTRQHVHEIIRNH